MSDKPLPFHDWDLEVMYTGCFTISGDANRFETIWAYPAASGIDSAFKVVTTMACTKQGKTNLKTAVGFRYRDPRRRISRSFVCDYTGVSPANLQKKRDLTEMFGNTWMKAVRLHQEMYQNSWGEEN